MGYKARRKTVVLRFEDPEMSDLEVRAYSASIGETIGFTRLSELVDAEFRQQVDKLDELLTLFASKLISWNIEAENDEGVLESVPATAAGLFSLDKDFAQEIVLAWLEGVVGIAAPLEQTSEAGVRELLDSLEMEPLPESPSLSTAPS